MRSRSTFVGTVALALAVVGAAPVIGRAAGFSPGAPGVGDRYFLRDGNGGYDVAHYDLDLSYRPGPDRLSGVATITATATQDLSRLNLDLDGLEVRSVQVDGQDATWTRRRGELRIRPGQGIADGQAFTTEVTYDGVPTPLADGSGFIHTDDGAIAVGEPHGASHWFPVNDHPSDKASYTFRVTAPKRLQVVANGELQGTSVLDGERTWTWEAAEPMASYLATIGVGNWRFTEHDGNGIPLVDAVDPVLDEPYAAPFSGDGFAFSQTADSAYKRLTRTLSVPADGGTLSFRVKRDTEGAWDFFFVEARTVGRNDWTTLPDENGHTRRSTGASCPGWLELHPFLRHYQSADRRSCKPEGTTGEWHARSGSTEGYERWTVDLGAYAGEDVRVSLSYASDESVQLSGVFVDDIVSTTGEGSTGFEPDGDAQDGWTAGAAPAGSPGNENTWTVGGVDDSGSLGASIDEVFARQGEILDFLQEYLGPYPFSTSGGIVDNTPGLGFALENQTRPVYDPGFFGDPIEGASVVVHELAHQWTGDDLAVRSWRHIWLNEGFASYMEWLWSEHEGTDTAAEIFDGWYAGLPRHSPFWRLPIGNPGPAHLFDGQVYVRGAMALEALRETVGDDDFFTILRTWTDKHAGGNVAIPQFIRLSEQVSGRQLDRLFDAWLYGDTRPARPGSSPRTMDHDQARAFLAKQRSRQSLVQ